MLIRFTALGIKGLCARGALSTSISSLLFYVPKHYKEFIFFIFLMMSPLTWTNLVSRRSICMRMSSQASHMQVSDSLRYCTLTSTSHMSVTYSRRGLRDPGYHNTHLTLTCSSVEMWVNLNAILASSGRQSDSSLVSS